MPAFADVPSRKGWFHNITSARLEFGYGGTRVGYMNASSFTLDKAQTIVDDIPFKLGTGGDIVLVERSATLNANTALSGVLLGTPVTQPIAADSLILSNITASGDIMVAANRAGNSETYVFIDSSLGRLALFAPADHIFLQPTTDTKLADGTGLIVGATAQVTISNGDGATDLLPEVQILGTTKTDSSMLLAAFNTTDTATVAPSLNFLKSGHGTIGTMTTAVAANEVLGEITWFGADGTDGESPAGQIAVEVDASVGTGDMPGRMVFKVTVDGGEVLTERLRITNGGVLTTLAAAPANITAAGAGLFAGGIGFTDVANAHIDDATHGSGTTTIYIGNQTITTASDVRVKTGIVDTERDALSLVRAMRVVDFSWADPDGNGLAEQNRRGRFMGVLAQEAVKVAPWIINAPDPACPVCLAGEECGAHTARWFVQYDHFVPALIRAAQQTDDAVSALAQRVAALEAAGRGNSKK